MPTGRARTSIGALAAVIPELYIPKTTAVAAGQLQPAHLTAHRRSGAVDPGVHAQPHHIAPTGTPLQPAEQLSAGKGSIR